MTTKEKKQISTRKDTCYNKLPFKVSEKDFNRYVKPFLSEPIHGPKHKVSLYKIFNYILYVLHTGIQWRELQPYRNEIFWTNIYKWHNRWSKDGSYEALFEASIKNLRDFGKLDLSVLHGDGSNVLAKKGVKE